MTIQDIIKEGLDKSKDERAFREWASRWIPGIADDIIRDAVCTHSPVLTWSEPLEVWAFRARERAGDKWDVGIRRLWYCLQDVESDLCGLGDAYYFVTKAAPYHWIIAGIIALEMKKEAKE